MSQEMDFTELTERVKNALAGAASGTGATMLPTETADEIIGIVYERNFMRSLFPAMPMSRRKINVPKLSGSVDFHQQSLSMTDAGTAAGESRHATDEITLELKTMIANIPIGNYLVAYGVEGLMSVLRDDIASRLAYNEQSLLINGDTTVAGTPAYRDNVNGEYDAANNPTGVSATANDYLLLFDGLRKSATATPVAVGGTFALSHLRTAIAQLGVYSDNRDDLALIVPRNLEVQLLGLTELQTVDKYGPAATILSGEIGKIYGIRVFGTGAIATNLNAAGIYDATTVDKTVAVLTHIRSPLIGNPTVAERRFSIGFHDEPTRDRFVLIPKQDMAFGVRYPEAICLMVGIATV
tara:strand:+ start:2178 stop:3236 length:1059 start_codon:yes stop_codon:yes gene_type:complete